MNFGGPVWHASSGNGTRQVCEREAIAALAGVGDPKAGQWSQWTGTAFHLRRRLTSNEEKVTGPVIDIRGTTEAMERVRHLSHMAQAWAKRIGEVPV